MYTLYKMYSNKKEIKRKKIEKEISGCDNRNRIVYRYYLSVCHKHDVNRISVYIHFLNSLKLEKALQTRTNGIECVLER